MMEPEIESKKKKTAGKIILWIAGIWLSLLIIVQSLLSPAILEKAINKFTSDFIDGNVSFDHVSVSVFRNFPNLSVNIDTVSVTYPTERFADYQTEHSCNSGRGTVSDTLMSFDKFSASVNIAALAFGQIRIPSLTLEKPRIFAKNFSNDIANWNIMKTMSDEADTVSSEIPKIVLGRIRLSDKPVIIYNSIPDTTSIELIMKSMRFNGRLTSDNRSSKHADFNIDSLSISGMFPADTVTLNLDMLELSAADRKGKASAKATTYLATKSYGRIRVPIEFKTEICIPEDTVTVVHVHKFKAKIADIPLYADAELSWKGDEGLDINAEASVNNCKVGDVLKYINKSIWEDATEIQTDATVTINASCKGIYNSAKGRFPQLSANMEIPQSVIAHKKYGTRNNILLKASMSGSDSGKMDLSLNSLSISGKAMNLSASGSVKDLIGKDPLFNFSADASVSLDTLNSILKQNSGISTSGDMRAKLKGKVAMSQMDPYKIAEAQIGGYVKSSTLRFKSEKDSLDVYADSLSIWIGAVDDSRDSSVTTGEHVLALVTSADSINVRYKDDLFAKGRKISITAANAASIMDQKDSSAFYPFEGKANIDFLALTGADTTTILIAGSENSFTITPKKENRIIPVLDLKSSNKAIFMRGPVNRIVATGVNFKGSAAMNSVERKQKVKKLVDSLAAIYPDIPKDSLFTHLRKMRNGTNLPEWLKEADFRKSDITIALDSSLRKMFMEWDAEGAISIRQANIITPFFPIKNVIRTFKGNFNNNEVNIDNLWLTSGTSEILASGNLNGIRGMVAGQGMLNMDLNISSKSMNINELLGAYTAGSKFNPMILSATRMDMSTIDDSDYQQMVVTDTLADITKMESSLFVIPANINANINLRANNVKFSNLNIHELQSTLIAKERCIQFTNTYAKSEIGNIDFEGFYATRSKQSIKTGFDFGLHDVTAEKVIELMPAVDTVIPMLKSFKGNLNCELAATADLDTNMNIVMPSINGIIRISGSNLEMEENEAFRTIAKKLMFKDKRNSHIDRMSVEGLIHDNMMEVFPFILKIDRYTMAMSGIQNLDMSFRYHISVLDSPIPFRLGVDIYGNNFDDFKFKIGKAKYKSTNVPVFTSVVDQTRLNLKNSIRKIFHLGVDKAIKENEKQEAINEFKSKIEYTQAVDIQLDSLSFAEKMKLDKPEIAVPAAE